MTHARSTRLSVRHPLHLSHHRLDLFSVSLVPNIAFLSLFLVSVTHGLFCCCSKYSTVRAKTSPNLHVTMCPRSQGRTSSAPVMPVMSSSRSDCDETPGGAPGPRGVRGCRLTDVYVCSGFMLQRRPLTLITFAACGGTTTLCMLFMVKPLALSHAQSSHSTRQPKSGQSAGPAGRWLLARWHHHRGTLTSGPAYSLVQSCLSAHRREASGPHVPPACRPERSQTREQWGGHVPPASWSTPSL